MAGPGGDEVARVSVRVVPDSSGFRSELARELAAIENSMKVEIPVEADTAGVRAEVRAVVASLSNEDIDIDVGADTAGARAETQAFVAATEAATAEIDVGADTAPARTEAAATRALIDAMKATIKVEIDVDKDKLGALSGAGAVGGDSKGGGLSTLTAGLTKFLGLGAKVPGVIGSMLGGLGSLASTAVEAGNGIMSLATGALGMTRGLGAVAGVAGVAATAVIAVAGAFVQAGAQIAMFAVIAGAVTAAVGAIGAAASGLPALLLGVGAAGVAVALGMEGIKRAAEAAAPGVNKLKKELEFVFDEKLTPMFRDLGERVLPQLTQGLSAVADSVSNLIINLAGVVTSAAGIANLNALFGNTQVLLSIITPSLQGLLAVFLEIGATTPVFTQLGLIISTVIGRVAELFAKFAEGGGASLMVRSLEQLNLVLDAALGAFNGLILGATEFFTAAGPGLTSFFRDLESTIAKIDFEGLGLSFGIFAAAVGTFIESVPPSVWQQIADAVRDLALKFSELANDPAVQMFFTGLVATIPIALEAFRGFLIVIQGVINFIRDLGAKFLQLGADIAAWAVGAVARVKEFADGVRDGVNNAVNFLREFPGKARAAISGFVSAIVSVVGDAWTQAVARVAAGVTTAVARIQAFPGQARAAISGLVSAIVTVVGQAWTQAVARVVAGVTAAVAQVREFPGKARAALGDLGSTLVAAGRALMTGLLNGIKAAAEAVYNYVSGIAGRIAALKGPIPHDRRVLIPAGEALIGGLLAGMQDTMGPVLTYTSGIANQIVKSMVTSGVHQQAYRLGQTIGEQIGKGLQTTVQDAFANLPNVIKYGSVSEQMWDRLKKAGWKGRAGDGMEALYRPAAQVAASWAAPGTTYEDGSVRGGRRAGDSPDDFITALQGITWSVDLDPEGVARIAARGAALRDRR